MESAVTAATGAVGKAKTTHDNTEKDHQSRLASLTKMVETQTVDVKTKQAAADQLASIVKEAREKLKVLEAEYQKLKSADVLKEEPTKTASK